MVVLLSSDVECHCQKRDRAMISSIAQQWHGDMHLISYTSIIVVYMYVQCRVRVGGGTRTLCCASVRVSTVLSSFLPVIPKTQLKRK